jgi:uncharacterized RDD family membrane protein YckC
MDVPANRYQPPQSDVVDADDTLEVVPAARWRRFLTFVIDYICFLILAFLVGLAVVFAGGQDAISSIERIPDLVFGVAIMMIYYVPMEAIFGRTVGKLVTGTRVVNEEGNRPSLGQIFGRTFARFIPFEMFSLFSSSGRGWHDSIPRTYVVMCR